MNPSFPLTVNDAKAALRDMKRDRRPLRRPLLILGGWMDPCFSAPNLKRRMRKLFDDDRILAVSFGFDNDFHRCRRRAVQAIGKAFPSDDPHWTTEVDVIGISMGGLVARYAAAPIDSDGQSRQLRIARLFTISTPHRGARLAKLPTFNRLQIAMRSDSPFMSALDESADVQPYPIFPYVRLGDTMVGPENASPADAAPWWVPTPSLQTPHLQAHRDPRIIADIARRLRGESPFTTSPPAPLPAGRQ